MDGSRWIREGDQTLNSSGTSGELIIFPSSINQLRVKGSLNCWNTRQTWTERASGKVLPFLPVDQKRARAVEGDTPGFSFSLFLFSPMITPKQFLEGSGCGRVTCVAVGWHLEHSFWWKDLCPKSVQRTHTAINSSSLSPPTTEPWTHPQGQEVHGTAGKLKSQISGHRTGKGNTRTQDSVGGIAQRIRMSSGEPWQDSEQESAMSQIPITL